MSAVGGLAVLGVAGLIYYLTRSSEKENQQHLPANEELSKIDKRLRDVVTELGEVTYEGDAIDF